MSAPAAIISFVALSLSAAAPQPAPESPGEPVVGLRTSGPYMTLSPAIPLWFVGTPVILYSWGASAGWHFARGGSFAAQVGGFLHHALHSDKPAFSLSDRPASFWHIVQVGPEFRVGGGDERLFGYFAARVGVSFSLGELGAQGSREVYPGFSASFGPGVQGALGERRRLLIGFEPAFGITSMMPSVQARVLFGWRF